MKGVIFRILLAALSIILAVSISLFFIEKGYAGFDSKMLDEFRDIDVVRPYSFDINDLIVNSDNFNFSSSEQQEDYYFSGGDPDFCKDVRNCIEMNIKGQNMCVISYKVEPGVEFSMDSFRQALSSCPSVDVDEELYSNTNRKICRFEPLTNYNELKENDVRLDKYQPELHNCYIPSNLGSTNVLDDFDSLNYLYSGRGTTEGYGFENGGTVRIVVTNVSIKSDMYATCSYSMYVCGQNAIATSLEETPVDVFQKLRGLDDSELYFNETIYWGGKTPEKAIEYGWNILWLVGYLLSSHEVPEPSNVYGYYPSYYEFNFETSVPNSQLALVDAIDAGMWEWNRMNYEKDEKASFFLSEFKTVPNVHFSYSPLEKINTDNEISFDSGCWKNNYEKVNNYEERLGIYKEGGTFTDSESLKNSIVFDDFDIGDKLRMVLGVKKIFISDKEIKTKNIIIPFIWEEMGTTSVLESIEKLYDIDIDPKAILVLDPITFCSE